ncbi:hypothetical protein VV01_10720 [Luteipulveratus halotolerans]|uniref:Glutamate--cysteine ligase EgtA n=1 Tax=Luteipulveratus halotolerans TaxID=1631356 RepID=A0A0L6CPB6_9MICO|nr:hypothetical protein VV01_10720 [Luteipulveratus halotolerans]
MLDTRDPVEAARAHLAEDALRDGPLGAVGIELEMHLVDLRRPERRPRWSEVEQLVAQLPAMPCRSRVSVEPGGQLELSTEPASDVTAAIRALAADKDVLQRALRAAGFGGAAIGADPGRRPQRINPAPRYVAMAAHFEAMGCGRPARSMMSSTAALQINLEAGPEQHWQRRLELAHLLGPVLIALSSTSPYLGGSTTQWHSMRQSVWQAMDPARTEPYSTDDPAGAWASYVLDAPVMAVREGGDVTTVTERTTFAQWLRGEGPIRRTPTGADLELHRSTVFPPVRPRGFIELRCLDAMPDAWWPAVTAAVVTLMDHPTAADLAFEACEPVRDQWQVAARRGPADPVVARALTRCLEVAALHAPVPWRGAVADLSGLFDDGRSPSGLLRRRIEAVGPVRVLEEESRA